MQQHDWLEGHEEFEAVLVCTNELPTWETDAAMRAFAIYHWTDATTAGDDSSLRHNESGTIIRHDGDMLAIDFGHGALNEALPDLFLALNALGWRGAEVYHPASTLNALLSDMGRAIPANLDFDVRPAKIGTPISDTPEGQMLLNSGNTKTVLQSTGAIEDTTILNMFRDLGNTKDVPKASISLAHNGVINLIDDDTGENTLDEQLTPTHANVAPTFADDFDETPLIPNLEIIDTFENQAEINTGDFLPETEMLFVELPDHHNEKASVTNTPDTAIASEHVQETCEAVTEELMNANKLVLDLAVQKLIKVGQSIFCFDMSHDPISSNEIESIAAEYKIPNDQIVHLRPGAIKEPVRWDVLGEIDPDYPWLSEKLVATIMPIKDLPLVSCIFLALKKNAPFAGLRDVLMLASKTPEELTQMFANFSPAAEMLLNHAKMTGLVQAMDTIVQRLGALALAPSGQSFVDLLDSGEFPGELQEAFTVREVMQSTTARIFVVHVDVLDSVFVETIAGSLRDIAKLHAATKRYSLPVTTRLTENTKPTHTTESSGEINAEVKEILGTLFGQLQKIGVCIPLTDQASVTSGL